MTDGAGGEAVVFGGKPFLECVCNRVRGGVLGKGLLDVLFQAVALGLNALRDAEAELGVVLKEGPLFATLT